MAYTSLRHNVNEHDQVAGIEKKKGNQLQEISDDIL